MNAAIANTAQRTGRAFHADPAAATKTIFFIAFGILLIFVLFKFLRGFSRASELISDFGPATETEKQEIITKPSYQDNVKWLDETTGLTAIAKAGYKNASAYLLAKKMTNETLGKFAQQIWDAKMPFYISETEVDNAIAAMPTKAAVSLLAFNFNYRFKDKVGYYPFNVFLSKYLKLKEMETLTKIIDSKPTV